ncbi:hypothetical protein [Allosphingosinicella deserti]|uniref:Uncharacterized protein n=1 Tax=Allosphingosinicella deserti TaxID=2116704 RepID=A0A2P7QFD4_9SPHN|nr:hypothetical protein [Sphingomonas deserti]PSJ36635.1 hypothetical protein C7I55_24900 [Sphingomonas deserti]
MASQKHWCVSLVGIALLSLPAACREGVRVTVEQHASGAVRFLVSPLGDRFRPCIDSLYVYSGPRSQSGRPLVWHVERMDPRICVAKVDFGAVPAGFEADSGSQPLHAGGQYEVAVMGPGFNDGAEFTRR